MWVVRVCPSVCECVCARARLVCAYACVRALFVCACVRVGVGVGCVGVSICLSEWGGGEGGLYFER